jgi:hypothetical protein
MKACYALIELHVPCTVKECVAGFLDHATRTSLGFGISKFGIIRINNYYLA